MENVSLTYFADFVLKAGTPKVTVVRDFKARDEYDPQTDFYKPLREKVISAFKTNSGIGSLESWAKSVNDKKRPAYASVVLGLKKFFGKKQVSWFSPPRDNFDLEGLVINVNPELGLQMAGTKHVIKLYLKDEPTLTKNRAQLILRVMERALSPSARSATFALLDARKSKLHTMGTLPIGIDALLAGEATSFKTMFQQL